VEAGALQMGQRHLVIDLGVLQVQHAQHLGRVARAAVGWIHLATSALRAALFASGAARRLMGREYGKRPL
jgi:hypothetical protein